MVAKLVNIYLIKTFGRVPTTPFKYNFSILVSTIYNAGCLQNIKVVPMNPLIASVSSQACNKMSTVKWGSAELHRFWLRDMVGHTLTAASDMLLHIKSERQI